MKEHKDKNDTSKGAVQGQFALQKVYIKDLSFKAQNSPAIFRGEWQPTLSMDLSNSATFIGDDLFDVVLAMTVTVNIGHKTAYLIEVHQAGIFLIKNVTDEIKTHILGTTCTNILFPFTRELVSDLVARAGFPQLLLQPVNFEILYLQQKEKGNEKKAARTIYSTSRC